MLFRVFVLSCFRGSSWFHDLFLFACQRRRDEVDLGETGLLANVVDVQHILLLQVGVPRDLDIGFLGVGFVVDLLELGGQESGPPAQIA